MTRAGRKISIRRGSRPIRWIGRLLAAGTCLMALSAQAEPAVPGLDELVEMVDLSGLAASPDGARIAFRTDRASIERNSYDLEWHVADLGTGAVRPVGSGGEAIIADPGVLVAEPPIWSPDGRSIFYRALRAGEVQIWRSAADGSGSRAVTAEEGDIISIEPSADRRGIVYRVGPPRHEIETAELDEYDSGILVDEHVELAQNVFRGAIINGRHSTQRLTGRWFARGGILWSRPARERKLDFATLETAPARPDEFQMPPSANLGPVPADMVARSSGGDVVSALWNGTESAMTITRPAAGPAHPIICAAAACRSARIVWLAWRPRGDQVLFATADSAHVQTVHLWDVGPNRVRRIASRDGLLNGGRSAGAPCASAATEAVCVSAGPALPPRLERVDLQSGAVRHLFDPNAILRSRRWPTTERLAWRSAEGRMFTGTLYLPAAGLPAPLFINYYRCEGFERGGVGDEWPFAALAAAGIASVCVNATRMSGPQDGVGQYRAAQGGIETLVALLSNRGTIDRTRIGMGGLSFGSEVTMWTVMHTDLIVAASVASPQFEASNYWFNGVRGRDHHQLFRQVWGLGAPDETPEQWRLLSPAFNVDRIRAPVLLQLSEQESRYAIELYARLSNSTTPTELYVFPDEAHIKVQPRHRLAAYRRNLDWFRFWLQGHEDSDPQRAEQYRRWRALSERAR